MDDEETEPSQPDPESQKPNQEQKDAALDKLRRNRALSYYTAFNRLLKNAWLDDLPSPSSYDLEWLFHSGSLDPQIVRLLLDYLSRNQKSSSFTKDEMKSLIAEVLNEATKASAALKPKPGDVLESAESQLPLIAAIYSSVLRQANRSFIAALIAAGIGLVFFIAAVSFLLLERPASVSIISLIAGALVEVIAGVNFYLYTRASNQLSTFHLRLDKTQNFLLANSVCENLEGEIKQQTRADLVYTIANSSGIPVSRDKRNYPKDEPTHNADKAEN
jgi:hypothetical protein